MTPCARQYDGIATRTVSRSGGRTCTVPAGASGTASAFSMAIVEAGRLRPANASHLTAGVIATRSSAAAAALHKTATAVLASKDALMTRTVLMFHGIDRLRQTSRIAY